MKIDSIEVFHLALPRTVPQETPFGTFDTLETVLVRMGGGGTFGWGEASPGNSPQNSPEWAAGVFGCVRDWLAPALVGHAFQTGADLDERWLMVQGNRFAKAALDMAWWDLKARLEEKPLYEVLGGQNRAIELGVSFDQMPTIDALLDAMRKAFEDGFSRVELKFRPGWDISMLNVVRHEFGVETIHVDIEGALRLDDMEILCRLDDFSLAMVEQPLPPDDLVGLAMVQETLRTPICLDESIATLDQADMALELKSCQYVNIKPGRVGGLTPAAAVHDACHEQCVPCYVGATHQTTIGARHGLALATKPNFSYPADYIPVDALIQEDVAEPLSTVQRQDGKLCIELGSEPGIGVEPDLKALDAWCLAKAKI